MNAGNMNAGNQTKGPPVPAMLLGSVLLFWGWQTGLVLPGMVLAIMLEVPRFLPWRLQPTLPQLNRLADMGALLFAGFAVWSMFTARQAADVITFLVQILPISLFPLLLAMRLAGRERLPASVLFLSMRKWAADVAIMPMPQFNLPYPFLGLCLLSAAAAEPSNVWYFPLAALLLGWALWPFRCRHYGAVIWIGLFCLLVGVGFAEQQGLHYLQRVIAEKTTAWLSQWLSHKSDPYKQHTSIGEVGELKLSHWILFRVKPEGVVPPPFLLREASFNYYYHSGWDAVESHFKPVVAGEQQDSWRLVDHETENQQKITVYHSFSRMWGVLPLPLGVQRIEGLPAWQMDINQFGAVRFRDASEVYHYRVTFGREHSFNPKPAKFDRQIPIADQAVLSTVATTLGLAGHSPKEVLQRVGQFFRDHFRYSLRLQAPGLEKTALGDFLLHSRAGHCEYFATATVLLLRQAGIPARYATGYSVQEYDAEEQHYLVRQSHAHAWALAYIDQKWQTVDFTPADWSVLEAQEVSGWQWFFDVWSHSFFDGQQWYRQVGGAYLETGLPWLMLIIVFIVIWRGELFQEPVLVQRRARVARHSAPELATDHFPFYQIEAVLQQDGWQRGVGENYQQWCQRLGDLSLQPMLRLHYRARFDADHFSQQEQQQLQQLVQTWLENHTNSQSIKTP